MPRRHSFCSCTESTEESGREKGQEKGTKGWKGRRDGRANPDNLPGFVYLLCYLFHYRSDIFRIGTPVWIAVFGDDHFQGGVVFLKEFDLVDVFLGKCFPEIGAFHIVLH